MCDHWEQDTEEIDGAKYYNIKDEKKILERKLVEDSDISLSRDLFGTNNLEDKNSNAFSIKNIVVKKIVNKTEIKKKSNTNIISNTISNTNHDDVFGRSENTDVYDENYGSIADKY